MPFPVYNVATDFAGVLDQRSLWSDLQAAGVPLPDSMAIDDTGETLTLIYSVAPDSAAKIAIDAVTAAHGDDPLELAKNRKLAAIDARTSEMIGDGFVYASKQFSLSLPSQSKMIGSHQIKDNPALVYPLKWNTKNDDDSHELNNAAELDGFYLTALGTIRARLDSGTELKDQVRAAADIAAVDAVVDDR